METFPSEEEWGEFAREAQVDVEAEVDFGELRAFAEYVKSLFKGRAFAESKEGGRLMNIKIFPEEPAAADLEYLASSLREDERFSQVEVFDGTLETRLTKPLSGIEKVKIEVGDAHSFVEG